MQLFLWMQSAQPQKDLSPSFSWSTHRQTPLCTDLVLHPARDSSCPRDLVRDQVFIGIRLEEEGRIGRCLPAFGLALQRKSMKKGISAPFWEGQCRDIRQVNSPCYRCSYQSLPPKKRLVAIGCRCKTAKCSPVESSGLLLRCCHPCLFHWRQPGPWYKTGEIQEMNADGFFFPPLQVFTW